MAMKALTPEELTSFMSKLLKLEVNQAHATFRYDISSFFELVEALFSLLSQILGLDSDQFVIEVMIGNLYLVSQSKEHNCFKYDEFLVERITFQLDNFHNSGNIFRYPTLLMLIVINKNLQTLQQMQPELFVDLSERNSTMTFISFTDRIMSSIYKLIFGTS